MKKIDLFKNAVVLSKEEQYWLRAGDSFRDDKGETSHTMDFDADSYSHDHNGDCYSNDSGTGSSVRLDFQE